MYTRMGNVKSRGRRKAKGRHTYTYFPTYNGVTRTHIVDKPHCPLLRGNVWHELVHCSKERVVLSGKSVIAVGVRFTDVCANELLMVRGCCVPYVE